MKRKRHEALAGKVEKWDAGFEEFRHERPGATFADFYVHLNLETIRQGERHTTLGTQLHASREDDRRNEEFEESGRSPFRRYVGSGGILPHHRVVDYGCGSLRLGVHFLKYLDADNYFGVDLTMDFINIGIQTIGPSLVQDKRPKFGAISETTLRQAKEFEPDFVVSNAVSYHVHPEELQPYLDNLRRLVSRPGSCLLFDAKLSASFQRYRRRGWAWPLTAFTERLAPLTYVGKLLAPADGSISSGILKFVR